jgi:hypothetical protein
MTFRDFPLRMANRSNSTGDSAIPELSVRSLDVEAASRKALGARE